MNLNRRTFLRASGTVLALPWLESLAASGATQPVRFVGMYHTNGVNPYKWYPTQSGRDYELPENVALLSEFRDQLTMLSGLAHWRAPQSAGHSGALNFLTGCGNGGGVAVHTSQSLDQYLAPHLGRDTRIESLVLSRDRGVGSLGSGISTMSFGPQGNPIPAENSPARVFERLFVEPDAEAKAMIRHRHANNQSILDDLMSESSRLNRRLGKRDKEKVDEYLTNVRRVEKLMNKEQDWLDVPRYPVDEKTAATMRGADQHDFDLMIDLMHLALISDTTRVITFLPMKEGGLYHAISHWNKNPDKQLPLLDEWDRKWISGLARLARILKATTEGDGTYLDRTVILYGGGHGRKPHYAHDLPVVVLGGKALGIKHGQHLAFQDIGEGANIDGREKAEDFIGRVRGQRQTALCNLHVSLANTLGVPTEKFGDSTGQLNGLI